MPRWLLTIPRLALLLAASPLLFAPPAKAQNAPPQKPAAAPSAQVFARAAGMAALFAIESSRIAIDKTSNLAVRQFAERQASKHRWIAGPLLDGAERDAKQETMLTQLRSAPASEFDRVYLAMQLKALQDSIQLHESYRAAGTDPALRAFAARATPVLQQQLADAAKIAGNLGTETLARRPILAAALPR